MPSLLLLSACTDVPKYKRSSGRFDEWGGYEGKHFKPSSGVVLAIDPKAGTVTISHGKEGKTYPVTAETRIIHEDQDIPLAQLPLQTEVKYTTFQDGSTLRTIWFGHRLGQFLRRPPQKKKGQENSYL